MSPEPKPVAAPALGRTVVLGVATLIAVGWMCRLVTPLPPPLVFETTRASATGARPPIAPSLDFGRVVARRFLTSGFGPDEVVDGRSAVRTLGPARIALDLVPDNRGLAVDLVVRSAGGPARLGLKLNSKLIGTEDIGSEWSMVSYTMQEPSIYSGKNELELEPGGEGLLVDSLAVEPVAARSQLVVREPGARKALTQGWVLEEIGGKLVAHVDRAPAVASLELRPRPEAYALALAAQPDGTTGQSTVELTVNGFHVGSTVIKSGGGTEVRVVPNEHLHPGVNLIELTRTLGPSVAVDRISLEPLTDALLLDIGTPAARAHLGAGFSADEQTGCGSCTWSSGARSRFELCLGPRPGPYQLVVRAHAFAPIAPVVATVTLNGQPLGNARFGETFESVRLAVPPGRLIAGENRIELTYDRTATPRATLPGSYDEREIALRFDLVELSPMP